MTYLNTHSVLATAALLLSLPATGWADAELRGRFHLDYAAHSDDRRDLGNKFLLRRARLGVDGEVNDNWSYRLEADFAENNLEAKNVYLTYEGWNAGELTIGHNKVPFGLERMTSSNNLTFIERSLPTEAFTPGRRIGFVLETGRNPWLAQAAIYGQEAGAPVRETTASEGLGASGRLVYMPRLNDGDALHLAVSAAAEQPENMDLRDVEFRSYPESRPTAVRLVDTNDIDDTRWINRLALEAAWESGPYSLQWEYIRADVDRRGGSPDVGFDGWYVSGSWVITGESRRYDDGRFRSVRPDGDGGAWEVAARLSSIDLNDGAINGGEETNITLGLNWYANRDIRFMLNAIFVDSENTAGDDNPTILLARTQLSF